MLPRKKGKHTPRRAALTTNRALCDQIRLKVSVRWQIMLDECDNGDYVTHKCGLAIPKPPVCNKRAEPASAGNICQEKLLLEAKANGLTTT